MEGILLYFVVIAIILVVSGILFYIAYILLDVTSLREKGSLPYGKKNTILSSQELAFYRTLKKYAGDKVTILAKVRLSDIFYVRKINKKQQITYYNKIAKSYTDFLVCDSDTLMPLLAIDIDTQIKKNGKKHEKDPYIAAVYEATNLQNVHVPSKRSYSKDDLISYLRVIIDKPALEEQTNTKQQLGQKCPQCGAMMIKTKAKRGRYSKKDIFVCPNFPKCDKIVPFIS